MSERTWNFTATEADAALAMLMVGSLVMAYRYKHAPFNQRELSDAMALAHATVEKLGPDGLLELMERITESTKIKPDFP